MCYPLRTRRLVVGVVESAVVVVVRNKVLFVSKKGWGGFGCGSGGMGRWRFFFVTLLYV